jgi:predicted nucleic acid-binding protein
MAGLTVLDAGVLIGALDPQDAHHLASATALEDRVATGEELIVPASVYAEILVHPSRQGDAAVHRVREFVRILRARIHPVDEELAVRAASIRAQHRVLLADAFVIATAETMAADVLTTDRGWQQSLGSRVHVVGGPASAPP